MGDATLMSSVGVKLGSIFRSSGLLTSEEGVNTAGTGRVGSRPAGYERGSARLILDREEVDEAMEGAMSLLPVELEKVDARESRDLHDDPEEDVAVELEVVVDMKDEAVELRRDSIACENILWIICGGCLASKASMCRIDSSGMSTWSSILARTPCGTGG